MTTDMTDIEATIATIANLAPRVSAIAEAHAVAADADTAAEAAVLDRVVALVRPALRALSSRPLVGERTTGLEDADRQRETSTRAAWAGLHVEAGGGGPTRDCPRDNSGTYDGDDLYLRSDGVWVVLAYEGTWSRWQGSTTEWSTTARVLTSAEVAASYQLAGIVCAVAKALTAHAEGKAVARTAAALDRTERLRAIVALLP